MGHMLITADLIFHICIFIFSLFLNLLNQRLPEK